MLPANRRKITSGSTTLSLTSFLSSKQKNREKIRREKILSDNCLLLVIIAIICAKTTPIYPKLTFLLIFVLRNIASISPVFSPFFAEITILMSTFLTKNCLIRHLVV
jgi:hypothetical protein